MGMCLAEHRARLGDDDLLAPFCLEGGLLGVALGGIVESQFPGLPKGIVADFAKVLFAGLGPIRAFFIDLLDFSG